jgi:hypothetical protein
MSFYRWAMRNGAAILFIASILIFVVSFSATFFQYGEMLARNMGAEVVTPSKVTTFTSFWAAFAEAATRSIWSFLGACLLYRLDHRWAAGERPRA